MIFKEAWNKHNKLHAEGEKLYAEGDKLRAEGYLLYTNEVIAFFGPKAVIDWDTGNVEGKPLPIPAAELKK